MRLSPPVSTTLLSLAIACAHDSALVQAASIEVNSAADDNGQGCTLREAVSSLNNPTTEPGCVLTGDPRGTNNMISFAAPFFAMPHTVELGSVLPIRTDIVIEGPGQNSLTISGGGTNAVLDILDSTVTINNLNISQGSASNGAGIYAQGETVLTLNTVTVSNNTTSDSGGGIYATDDSLVTLNNSIVSQNMAAGDGGGIYADGEAEVTLNSSIVVNNTAQSGGGFGIYKGSLSLSESTVSSNTATESGGGIFLFDYGAQLVLSSSTVSNNVAISLNGGGVYANEQVTLNIANSTLSGNAATAGSGGAISLRNSSTGDVLNTTIAHNQSGVGSGGGLYLYGMSNLNLGNTVVANNSFGNNCVTASSSTVNDFSSNWFDDISCNGNSFGDAKLSPLQDNGGNTLTHAPITNSGLLGAGDNAICTTAPINNVDQLGSQRGNPCSIGAVEKAIDISTFFTIPIRDGKMAIIVL